MQIESTTREKRLNSIVGYAPVGIVQLDPAGTIIEMNAKAHGLLQSVASCSNEDPFCLLKTMAPIAMEKLDKAEYHEGLIFKNEVHIIEYDKASEQGQRYWQISASWIDRQCIVLAFDDITEQHQQQLAMLSAISEKAVEQGKSELAADILHDIGNAVVGLGAHITRIRRGLDNTKDNLLTGLADFLQTQEAQIATSIGEAKAAAATTMARSLADNHQELHAAIRESVNGQLAILAHIQEILNIQRQYVAGKETGARLQVNLRGVIMDSLSMLTATVAKRGIQLHSTLTEEPTLLRGDRTRLMQVVMNLLKNSIEAIDLAAETKTITVSLERTATELELTITDSGCGFDLDTAGKLFGRGFTTKPTGTGLGLSNCREIIESHKGTITIASAGLGKGASTLIKFML